MAPTTQENIALVREFLNEVVAGGDTDALDIFLSDEADDHQLVLDGGLRATSRSSTVSRVLAASDVEISIDDTVAAADRVAVRGTVTGTHRESLADVAPTGRSFAISFAWFFRVENGKIEEIWSIPDGLGLLRELNACPDGRGEDNRQRP